MPSCDVVMSMKKKRERGKNRGAVDEMRRREGEIEKREKTAEEKMQSRRS